MIYGRHEVLREDYERMTRLRERSHGLVNFQVDDPRLPQTYLVAMNCKGVALVSGRVKRVDAHQLAIHLGPDYPVERPAVIWRTPIFHPNILPPGVCWGRWSAKTRLDVVCLWFWDMARYRNYNLTDALDNVAAEWARQHEQDFPLDETDLSALVAPQSSPQAELKDRIKFFDAGEARP